MDMWIGLAGLAVVLVGGLGGLAYRNDRTWPGFRNVTLFGLANLLAASGWIAVGAGLTNVYPEQGWDIFATAAVVCGCTIGLLGVVWFADWNRKP